MIQARAVETSKHSGRIRPGDWLFDIYLFLAAWVFLSGGEPFIRGPLLELVRTKPWMHRAAVAGVVLLAVLWVAWRDRQGRLLESPFMKRLAVLRLSAYAWTWMVFLTLAATWTVSSWVRHEAFQTSFDMAIFVQAVWNTLQGSYQYSSIKGGICLLADHFSPLLGFLALPYGWWPDPKNLLLMQAVAAAACVFPIYRIAKYKTDSAGTALVFVVAYALYLPVRNAVRFDFHAELLVTPLFLWAFYLLVRGRLWLSSFFLLVCLTSKEGASVTVAAIGFYAFFFLRARFFGILWMILPTAYFFSVLYWIIPTYFQESYFYLDANYLAWKDKGVSALAQHLLQKSTWVYLIKIFGPLGFLSFLSPAAFLMVLPALAQNLVARNEMVRSIFFQYTAFLTPFMFVAAIDGSRRIRSTRWVAYLVITASLLMSGVSEYYVIRRAMAEKEAGYAAMKRLMAAIPEEASVRTHEFLAPHLAHRRGLHIYENTHQREGGSAAAQNAEYVVLLRRLLGSDPGSHIRALENRGYEIVDRQEGLMVFRKEAL